MYISQAKATLTDRWMLRPKLSELETEQLKLQSHFTNEANDITVYIHKIPKDKKPAGISLKKLDIKSISVMTDINSVRLETISKASLHTQRKSGTNLFEGLFICDDVDLAELTNALQT